MWFSFLLVPLLNLLSFLHQWFKGFSTQEILERRFDWMLTNIMTTLFLTGFKPSFLFLKNLFLFPFHFVIGLFWPEKNLNYYHKLTEKNQFKQEQIQAHNDKLQAKNDLLMRKIEMLEKKKQIKKNKREEKEEQEND